MHHPIAEVLRGDTVESRHTGAFAVTDAEGGLFLSGGDPGRQIFPRSAIKAFQALPFIVSGTAAHFGFTGEALALSCASHTGMNQHAATAAAMLARAGRDDRCLECGTHWPTDKDAAHALAASGARPSALHNNCSGKHAAFVCTCVAAGQDVRGYVLPGHPIMRSVIEAVAEVTQTDLRQAPVGIDGCSIPTFAIPLTALASGFARFGTGRHLPAEFAAAAPVLMAAVAENPMMIAGEGKFDTLLTAAFGGRLFVKSGAEGVCCGAIPELGLGFAVKADDGTMRAAEAATASLLRRLLGPIEILNTLASSTLTNWNGLDVGAIVGLLG